MDYTIYIILGALAILYFMTKGMNRKKTRDRKSRSFMDGYKKEKRGVPTKDSEPEK